MSLFVQRDWLYGRIIYLVANSYFKSSYCPLLSNGQSIFSRGKLAAKCPEIEFFSPTIMQKIFKILKKNLLFYHLEQWETVRVKFWPWNKWSSYRITCQNGWCIKMCVACVRKIKPCGMFCWKTERSSHKLHCPQKSFTFTVWITLQGL